MATLMVLDIHYFLDKQKNQDGELNYQYVDRYLEARQSLIATERAYYTTEYYAQNLAPRRHQVRLLRPA